MNTITVAHDMSDTLLERMRVKYRTERDKRLRPDGRRQFTLPEEVLSRLTCDPNANPVEREPLTDKVDAIVIGGGFGGLMAGARLRQLGFDRVRIVDQASDVGGTWYWNRYPGARCDIESYIYMPLLEETGYMPTEKFVTGTELLDHARRIANHFDLYRDACFDTQVTKMEWDASDSVWIVHSTRGDRMRARFAFVAPGPLQRAHLPDIRGITDFQGHSFLTSRWDFEYTKGDVLGGLAGLSDKRVALIGTGATGVQVAPLLAEYSKHLYVVQRTPTPVGPRPNPPTDPEWARSLEPGWQERRMHNFAAITNGVPQDVDLVDDEWTHHFAKFHAAVASVGDPKEKALAAERADLARDEYIRGHVSQMVIDPDVAEKLKHYYRYFCKRPTFSAAYLQAFNRPNVTLVDTDGRGPDRMTEKGIVFDGVEYEVDCIIFASGFAFDADYHVRSGFPIIGRGGLTLEEKWKDGVRTLHSANTNGFPNLFLVGVGAQGGYYLNFINKLDQDLKIVTHTLEHMLRTAKTVVEPTKEAEDAWVEEIKRLAVIDMDYLNACTPGQYNNWGEARLDIFRQNSGYGLGPIALEKVLQDWRDDGGLKGLSFS